MPFFGIILGYEKFSITICWRLTEVSPEGAWQDLHTFDKNNHLMAATATYSADESDSGLVHKHAYSVLKVVEVEGFRLVSLRNPWGTDAEWNGPWSDRSPEWRAHPSIAKALNVDFQTEGTFWMDWEDWMYCMGQLKIMNCKMPTSRGDFHSTFAEIDEDGEPDAGGGNDFGDEDGPIQPKEGKTVVPFGFLEPMYPKALLVWNGIFKIGSSIFEISRWTFSK